MRNLPILSLINRLGKKVYLLKRTENIDDSTGEVYYTYPNTIELKCLINEVGGILLPWLEFGLKIEGDLQLLFKAKEDLSKDDIGSRIVLTNDEEYEISNVIRCGPIDPSFIEVICKRI